MMSYPRQYRNEDTPVTGVLSGWSKLTTSSADGSLVKMDHDFTIPDLMKMLKVLRREFDPDKIAHVEELIERHIARKDNPHADDLSKLNTSVKKELYELWLEHGNQGSVEDFLGALFQYVEIADLDATREGTSHHLVVSALGLKTIMTEHDRSLDSHSALFSTLFPGEPLDCSPSWSIDAYVGLPTDIVYRRPSPMTVVTAAGVLCTVPENSVAIDYSTGKPAIPLFGGCSNYFVESETLRYSPYWTLANATLGISPTVRTFRDGVSGVTVIRETATTSPVIHSLNYIGNLSTQEGRYYTVSCFVVNQGRDYVGIDIPTEANAPYVRAHFGLSDQEVFVSDNSVDVSASIYPLFDSWYRISMTYKATESQNVNVCIYPIDVLDGDEFYEGNGESGIGVFGCMFSESTGITPYIPSLGNRGVLAPSTLLVSLDADWYNAANGTFVSVASPIGNNVSLGDSHYLYEIAGQGSVRALALRYSAGSDNRAYAVSYNEYNELRSAEWLAAGKDLWPVISHGYSPSHSFYGCPDGSFILRESENLVNPQVSTLYIGTDAYLESYFNGFLRRLYYYPKMLTSGNHIFFMEDRVRM